MLTFFVTGLDLDAFAEGFFSASDFILSPMTLKKGLERVRGVYAITPFLFVSGEGLQPEKISNKVIYP